MKNFDQDYPGDSPVRIIINDNRDHNDSGDHKGPYYGEDREEIVSEYPTDRDTRHVPRRYIEADDINYDIRDHKTKRSMYPYTTRDKKQKVDRDTKVLSVRRRFYEMSDMDQVLRDKIATQLRQNGISETKVISLSSKITQAVKDDVIDDNNKASPEVTANLKEVINKHLDPILYNKPNTTDLKDYQKPSDAKHLSNLVLMRVGQVHEEIDLCKKSVDDAKGKKGKGYSPGDDSHDRSTILAIQEGLKKQKTENDILKSKLKEAEKEKHEVADDKEKKQEKLENLDSDNWKLKKDLHDKEQDKRSLLAKLSAQQTDYMRLDKQHQDIREENGKLRDRLNDSEFRTQNIAGELLKLQSENARLKVLADQKEKEILHLRDPDQEMVHQMKILSDEVTLLRTQTRRLNEEKGILKSRSQKLESNLDESYKQKNRISVERENLERENEDLKQRYRKLALSDPHRTLPDINSGRNGPSSRANSRSTSRARSRNVQNSDDRRLATTRESDEEK